MRVEIPQNLTLTNYLIILDTENYYLMHTNSASSDYPGQK